jgi:hypothetical protein
MTALYKSEKNTVLRPEYDGNKVLMTCETFDRSAFDAILAQKGCAAVRVYFGMSDDLKVKVMVVGVDADNKDILPAGETAAGDPEGVIVEEGRPCPDFCPIDPL